VAYRCRRRFGVLLPLIFNFSHQPLVEMGLMERDFAMLRFGLALVFGAVRQFYRQST
jgi:hypothetical protein